MQPGFLSVDIEVSVMLRELQKKTIHSWWLSYKAVSMLFTGCICI